MNYLLKTIKEYQKQTKILENKTLSISEEKTAFN
jgi:hypothetical protein